MSKFWSHFLNYLSFRQIGLLGGLLLTTVCLGQTAPNATLATRMPASYVPDDDVIIKPIDNELSFYQQYVASDNSRDVVQFRNQIKVWNDNEAFAQQYGLHTTLAGSPYFVPSPEQKWEYFQKKYFRYLKRKGEQPFKDMPKNWYQEYRASNEVDTIDEMEARFQKSTEKGKKSNRPKVLQAKEYNILKDTKIIFQPRPEVGILVVGIKNKYVYTRAWVGMNGETEVNFQHNIDSIGFRTMFNYYAHSGEYFTSIDKRLIPNLYARYTIDNNPLTGVKNDTFMLLYGKSF